MKISSKIIDTLIHTITQDGNYKISGLDKKIDYAVKNHQVEVPDWYDSNIESERKARTDLLTAFFKDLQSNNIKTNFRIENSKDYYLNFKKIDTERFKIDFMFGGGHLECDLFENKVTCNGQRLVYFDAPRNIHTSFRLDSSPEKTTGEYCEDYVNYDYKYSITDCTQFKDDYSDGLNSFINDDVSEKFPDDDEFKNLYNFKLFSGIGTLALSTGATLFCFYKCLQSFERFSQENEQAYKDHLPLNYHHLKKALGWSVGIASIWLINSIALRHFS